MISSCQLPAVATIFSLGASFTTLTCSLLPTTEPTGPVSTTGVAGGVGLKPIWLGGAVGVGAGVGLGVDPPPVPGEGVGPGVGRGVTVGVGDEPPPEPLEEPDPPLLTGTAAQSA